MNTYIIIGVIAAIGIAIFLFTRKGKSKPPPSPPKPPVEPPKPEPPKPEPPKPPIELALPVPPPMPAPGEPPPPFPIELRAYVSDSVDIGAAIMAVQNQQPNAREIFITESGELKTPVTLNTFMCLRIMPGVVVAPRADGIPFRLMEFTRIVGERGAVILESESPSQWTVIAGFYGTKENGLADADITLHGLEIRGVKDKPFNSAPQAISLGNCKKFLVEKVHVNGTHSIGLQAGGGGMFGHAAEDGRISNVKFSRVASQSLAVVNARRLVIENIFVEAPGQPGGPGSHPIDCELNGPDDALFDIKFKNIWIDFRGASQFGNGLLVQCTTGSPEIGQIDIEKIRILGGNPYPPDISNWCSNGIYVFGNTMRDVSIRDCEVWRCGQAGLNLEGHNIHAEGIKLVNCGGGGVPGARVNHMTGSLKSVFYRYTGHGPADGRLIISDSPDVLLENVSGFEIVRE